MDRDLAIRSKTFEWLAAQTRIFGDVLPRTLLQEGFFYQENRIPLVSPQGIFKPRLLDMPLSITTSPNSPYDDSFNSEGYLVYKYRGTNLKHPDNVGLRETMRWNRPLVYFHGIVPGKYLAVWPIYIIGDNPKTLSFTVAVDELTSVKLEQETRLVISDSSEGKRAYLTATVRRRLHQRSFREKVLDAYRSQCAMCRLRHRELLDASHIIPDTEEAGYPVVSNGMALCKFHHAAYDSFLLGITADYMIVIREDVLAEIDGPLLKHGLQELHQSKILLPSRREHWPNQDALDWRFAMFQDSVT